MLRRVAAACAALLAFGLVTAAPASAFASLPGGPHDEITGEAARRVGFPADAVEALQQAVREPDFQDTEYDPQLDEPARMDADHEYEPSHHCDRVAPATDLEAFNATVDYIGHERAAAANASMQHKVGEVVSHLGRALHAIQDCYSHTNVVDFGRSGWTAHQEALIGDWDPLPGLRLVAYDPGADEPGRPEGDPYPHDGFAKDSSGMNAESKLELADGRTKYEAARDLATDASEAFLRNFVGGLPGDERSRLFDAKPEDAGLPDDVPIPAGSVLLVMSAMASAFALVARSRRGRA
jgi:hypothetical protein